MSTEDRIERARTLYERAVFGGDVSGLTDAERGLDAVEADAALAPWADSARAVSHRALQRRIVARRGPR